MLSARLRSSKLEQLLCRKLCLCNRCVVLGEAIIQRIVIADADDLAMYLLEVGHVATVGGTSFGAPECIRFSYATSDENIVEAFKRIKAALAELK